jgi:hypothetical protein
VRTLIAVVVVLAMAAIGAAASPATTLLLGGLAITWLLLSFDADGPV